MPSVLSRASVNIPCSILTFEAFLLYFKAQSHVYLQEALMAVIWFLARNAGLFLAAPFVLIPLAVIFRFSGKRGAGVLGNVLLFCGALSIILFFASIAYA